MNIFVAGFHHETNTFAPSFADWAAFESGAGYPAYRRGAAVLDELGGSSLPVGGFVAAARARGWQLCPSVWAGAMPSNKVTTAAFERICGEILADLDTALAAGIDGIYLDLHGAAVAEGHDDAEGELLARIRHRVGHALPLVASLDLHANLTEAMFGLCTAMTAFRTYPHVDMRETGARAAAMLAERLARPAAVAARYHRRIPFLLGLNTQCTLSEPAATVIRRLTEIEAEHGVALSFAMGFAAADFSECGPVVFGYGDAQGPVQQAVDALYAEVVGRRAEWRLELMSPDDAVREALGLARAAQGCGPVVIADTQDNPGAGGDANTTGLLHALLRGDAGGVFPGRVALGLLWDPAAAAAAHAAGLGAELALDLGRSVTTFDGSASEAPVHARVRVQALHDGHLALHGPMTAGLTAHLGPCARLDVAGIQVLVSSAKAQMLDVDLYRFLGIEPAGMAILVNKSSVHFRAAFAPLAAAILVAKAPGPMAADPRDLPWQKLPASTLRGP